MNAISTIKQTPTPSAKSAGPYAPPTVRSVCVGANGANGATPIERARLALATAEAERFCVLERLLATK